MIGSTRGVRVCEREALHTGLNIDSTIICTAVRMHTLIMPVLLGTETYVNVPLNKKVLHRVLI